MLRWLFVILGLFVGFCLLSMAAFIALPWIMQLFSPKVGVVLVYEMENVPTTQNASVLADETADAISLRLKTKNRQYGVARVIEGNRIEVSVYGSTPLFVENVTEKIEFNGTLEFRIVANMHKHKEIIEIAKDDPKKSVYLNSKGEWTARWYPIKITKLLIRKKIYCV